MSKPSDNDLLKISKLIAKISTSLLTGSSIYMNLIEYPAKMECGVNIATKLFAPSYRKDSLLSLVLASTGFLGALSSYAIEQDNKWLAAGLLTFSIIPFKYLIMSSTTSSLLKLNLSSEKDPEKANLLLEKWHRMNFFKTLLCFSSMLLMELYS